MHSILRRILDLRLDSHYFLLHLFQSSIRTRDIDLLEPFFEHQVFHRPASVRMPVQWFLSSVGDDVLRLSRLRQCLSTSKTVSSQVSSNSTAQLSTVVHAYSPIDQVEFFFDTVRNVQNLHAGNENHGEIIGLSSERASGASDSLLALLEQLHQFLRLSILVGYISQTLDKSDEKVDLSSIGQHTASL